ncbi:glutathione peroxidase [Microbispora sp. NBC_01189]|uniref:glutathione peroxidase n=1 Tax=unclassified Microbispora TaxID=2614687 RepID=UPI002E10EF5C|nr:glutathione peroxidase [Microbispora sp. NBC_01189]
MSVLEIPVNTIDGAGTTVGGLLGGRAALVVNVASRCGLTPQYGGLVALQRAYADRDFTVVGVPCNQFMGQEPGSAEEIVEFCSTTYGVDFPLLEKTEVNGPGQHPLYAALTAVPDTSGSAGDVEWNFEKFLVSADGEVVARFRPRVAPESPEIAEAIEKVVS